jgi:hypothetical protein
MGFGPCPLFLFLSISWVLSFLKSFAGFLLLDYIRCKCFKAIVHLKPAIRFWTVDGWIVVEKWWMDSWHFKLTLKTDLTCCPFCNQKRRVCCNYNCSECFLLLLQGLSGQEWTRTYQGFF